MTTKASAGRAGSEQDGAWKRQLRTYLKSVPAYGSTTDVITDVLREAILDGVLAPSTWLREDELASELSVSRTPVREALRRLSDERLAVRLVNRGTVVTSISLDDVVALFLVREQLEGAGGPLGGGAPATGFVERPCWGTGAGDCSRRRQGHSGASGSQPGVPPPASGQQRQPLPRPLPYPGRARRAQVQADDLRCDQADRRDPCRAQVDHRRHCRWRR